MWLARVRAEAAPLACAAAVFAVSVLLFPDLRGALGGLLGALMVGIAVVDARRFIIPNTLVLAALLLGVVQAVLDPWSPVEAVTMAALRGLAAFGAFYVLQRAYARLRGREGLGFGDVKLAGVAGVWLDWLPLAMAIEIAALGALFLIGLRAFRKRRMSKYALIPFGLFLAPAIWIGWLLQALFALG